MDRTNVTSWVGPHRWLKLPLGGISISEVGGIWANVDGTHIVNLIALAILGIGSSCVGVWHFYQTRKIDIEEKRRVSLTRVPPPPIIVSPAPSKEVKP